MTNKEVILKAVQYIESNLKSEITVFQVSQEVCYSLYHFIRLFQSITGFSPKSYLQQRRLSEAFAELRNTDKKISEIAYDFQFGSPEAFTRAFRKQFNASPTDIRSGYPLNVLPLVNRITPENIMQADRAKCSSPELVNLPEKILVGLSFFLPEDSAINDLSGEWGRLMNEVHTISGRVLPERYYQVQYWSEHQELGGLYFFTGVEVLNHDEVNPLFVVKKIPGGKYLRFTHKGFSNMVGHTYKYIYTQFLPETGYKLTKPLNFEYYGPNYLGPYNEKSESEIYIPVE